MTDPWRDPRSGRPLACRVIPEGHGFVAQCQAPDVASDDDTEAAARAHLREALELYFEDTADPQLAPETL